MPDKQDKKTKITPEAPAGQSDNGQQSMDIADNGNQSAPAEKKKTEEKRNAGGIKGAVNFINDVKNEAKKITWPPRSQVMQETWSVIVMVAFITFMVLGFDYALGNWIFGPIEHAGKMMAPATPDPLFTETPAPQGSPSPDAASPVPAPVIPGTTTPVTPAPDAAVPGAPGTAPNSTLPVPEGTRPNLPAPTSPSTPSAIPGATTPPVTTPPATTTPAVPQTPAPGATTPTTTAPQAPATPSTPHP